MKTWQLVGILILASAGLGSEPSAHAFTLLYNPSLNLTALGWQQDAIAFSVDTSCASFLSDVNAAVGTAQTLWNDVPSSALTLSIGATTTLPDPITNYVGTTASEYAPVASPIIYCDTNFGADSGVDANQIPGFAAGQNFDPSGKLVGGLLVLNFQTGALANVHTLGASLASIILAHEMGHVLGLGHSSDPNALMYYQTSTSRQLILAQDDVNGISYLYPRAEPGTGKMFGCGTTTFVGGSGGAALGRRGSSKSPGDAGLPPGALEFGLLLAFATVAWQLTKRSPVLGHL